MLGNAGKLTGNGDSDMLGLNGMKTGFMILAVAAMAGAHLSTDGMRPTAGESLVPGTTYQITWKVTVVHKGTNIDLSLNGGQTWTTIKENFKEGGDINKFNWTVAGAATQTAKIRICQHESENGQGCKDSDRTNLLSSTTAGEHNYVLISPVFTIASTSGLGQTATGNASIALDFNPVTRNVNASFTLSESGPVLLQAFDTQGRLLATLVEGDYAAGSHNLSLFSNRLETSGALLFKLQAGARVQSWNWTPAR
jgi:hypothetical protein